MSGTAPSTAGAPTVLAPAAGRRGVPLGVAGRRRILVVGDLAVVFLLTGVALRLGAYRSGWEWSADFTAQHAGWYALFATLWVGLAWANGLYDPRRAPEPWTAAVLSAKVSAQILLVWAVAYFVPPPWTLVRHVVVFFTLGAAVAMPVWRQLYAAVFSRSAFRRRILIVGAGWSGETLLEAIRSAAPHEFEVAGFADDDPRRRGEPVGPEPGVRVVADRTDLVAVARQLGVGELVLAVTHDVHGDLFRALMEASEQGLAITPMPVMYEAITGRVPVEHIGDHWAVALPLEPHEAHGLYPLVRRAFDLAFAAVGLVLLALLLPIAGLLIRLAGPGPIFYRQVRVGRGGRQFMLYKLRTMVEDAEPEGPVWAARHDPRVTPVGRWLRRTRLDELPQVVNVLRGEMSVVGPRPERPEFVAALATRIPFYRARHAVRPGLTGWATVQQGYASSAEDALMKLQYDLYYIKHRSLWLDAYILVRTVAAVLRLGGR